MEQRQAKVIVETDRYRVEGHVTLASQGHLSRLSDHINRRDLEFLAMVDARLTALDGSGHEWTAPFMMLARRHIRLIVPADGD